MNKQLLSFIFEDITFCNQKCITNTIDLFQSGATVPFIARYRKEQTNNLDEDQIREIQAKLEYYTELEKRKETIIKTITEQGKLTEQLNNKIISCKDKTVLEDLYLPYKPKKRTRATIAKEKGLEKLADIIINQELFSGDKDAIIAPFIDEEKGVKNAKEALNGAQDIIAERIADIASIRSWIRNFTYMNGILTVKVKKAFEKEKTKFEMYYDFEESIKNIPSHRMLAIKRGTTEKILSNSIKVEIEPIINYMRQNIFTKKKTLFADEIKLAIDDSYKRLIAQTIETELITLKLQDADEEAIKVFAKNLHSLLLSAPAGSKTTLGIDPGFRTGCKVVVIDQTGKFLTNTTIYQNPPQNETAKASQIILELVKKYNVELIAIGNGTASRETETFVNKLIKDNKLNVTKVVVNESGASIYSASSTAKKEFPDLDLTVRGAISIARRLQDPLAELVKIDPKSIGVGQYQHDVNQVKLKESLGNVVESCVNYVGVELNTASTDLLSFVSGIGPTIAQNIISYRNDNKHFKNRKELLKVTKLGPKAYEQCAGFLKIRASSNPLDNSSVHPESYHIVEKMAKDLNVKVADLISNNSLLEKINPTNYVDDKAGLPTIKDIINELKKPGRDPREEFKTVQFDENVTEMKDLIDGMELEGTVTNVTKFGAFVDIGVHQDGLVHVSQLADRYVSDPNDIVKPGQIVTVTVLSVDKELKRISLSMKKN